MEYYFITKGFKIEIDKNAVNATFPNLNIEHKTALLNYLINIIDTIAIKFNFDLNNRQIYEHQFRQNNYRDTIGLLYMLLPFIDDITGNKLQKLSSLNELYIAKKNGVQYDINEQEPKYEYTNLQYGRCLRIAQGNTIKAVEIDFSIEYLTHNYLLLLDTIRTVANKLYVNWIHIRPVDPDTVINTKYYKITNEAIKLRKIIDWPLTELNDDSIRKFGGAMSAGEIYNILSNYLFHEIKNIKWILYDIYVNKHPFKYLYYINDILDINNCVKNVSWYSLSDNEQRAFNEKWNSIINSFVQNASHGDLSANDVTYVLQVMVFFFDKYYHDPDLETSGYVGLNMTNIDDEEQFELLNGADEKELINKIKITAKSLINLGMHVYEYIRDCLYQLRFTWYSQFYLVYDKNQKTFELNPIKSSNFAQRQGPEDDNLRNFTIKNMYNFAKSLISYTDNNERIIFKKYKQYPRLWKSINDIDKKIILERINNNPESGLINIDWFNIRGQLKKRMDITNQNELKQRNTIIYLNIVENLAAILLDVLSKNGLLSEFVPDPALSDYDNLPKSTNDRNDAIRIGLGQLMKTSNWKTRFEESFYYINNLQYDALDITYKCNDVIKTEKYLDVICNPKTGYGNWIYTYAMDWISQIGFFHHYLNNRIIYITGGTGVGKSTQIPKLLLYSLKMIDYKENGRIGCTQPRIPPTVNNAKTISEQMGIPIETYNKSKNSDIPTNNYYIQYQYKEKGHNVNQRGLTLKIMTDGVLETQLKNPVLKTMNGSNYTEQNVYDIVIVDEAHEHNKNMDLILTRMKYVTYYNNDIKLVIISATMDDDEAVYRRYYRDINDNRMYPLNLALKKHNLDRINVDRRMHISPPKESTQYKIEEHYVPKIACESLRLKEKQSCLDDHAVQITLNILKTTTDGDILVFQPGEGEIKTMVEALNQVIPANVIALPYFSGLSDTKKTMIEKIDKFKNDLTLTKNTPFELDEQDSMFPTQNKVAKGTYKRIVIVGTNIAEASITISTLKYVVDDGIQKTSVYDYKIRSSALTKTGISESSRLQRKGRVGRVAPGIVYYLYPEKSKENNKRQFNIAIEDLSDKLFEMLKDNENEPFFDNTNDPNNHQLKNINQIKKLYKYGLNLMITKQYFTKNDFYDYIGNEQHYDYSNAIPPYIYYKSGIDLATLNDETGSFYIVHPNELCFNRNILGLIVNADRDCGIKKEIRNNKVVFISDKMITFWNILKEYLFVIENQNNKSTEPNIRKTAFGSHITQIKQQLSKLNLQQVISYIYSRKYKCVDDIVKVFAMHATIRSISDIIYVEEKTITDEENNEKTLYMNKLEIAHNLYGNCHGDSYGLIKISNDIIELLTRDQNISNEPDIISTIINYKKTAIVSDRLLAEKKKFISGLKNNDYSNVDTDVLYNFLQMYNTNRLSLSDKLLPNELNRLVNNNTYINNYVSQFKNQQKENYIKKWCSIKHLSYTKIISFFNTYLKLLNDISKCENNIQETDPEIEERKNIDMTWFDSHTPQLLYPNDIHANDLVTISLLHGYGYNLIRNIAIINYNYYYISVFNPYVEYIHKIGKLYKPKVPTDKDILNNTLLLKKCMNSTLLYISKKDDGEDVNFIDNVNPSIISKVLPLMVNLKNYNINQHEKYVREFLHKLSVNKESDVIKNKIIGKYVHTIESIKHDLINNYNNNVIDKLSVIFDNDKADLTYLKKQMDEAIGSQNGGMLFDSMPMIHNSYVKNLYLLLNTKN